MSRFVIDVDVVLLLVADDLEVSDEHQLVAPALIRSQVLAKLFESVRHGELSEQEALNRHRRFGKLKIRLLGDAVLRKRAWDIAKELGWNSTYRAEYIAVTQLQADAFVTLDPELGGEVQHLVAVAPLGDLLKPG